MNIRQMTRLALVSTVWMGLSAPVAHSAYLDDGSGITRDFAPPERRPPVLPPGDDNPLRRLVRRVEIGRPCTYGQLAVFPLILRDTGDATDIRALDEALNRGWISIREQKQARVSEVVVWNESRHPVFMMAGEILGGGRQDRIVRSDVLVRPTRDSVTVPVYCGEQDRWQGSRESFDSASHLAGQAMRSMAARAASQDAIWSEIDHRLKESGASAPTRSYQSMYSDRATGKRIDAVTERFRDIRTRRTVGLILVDRGRIVGGDLFGDSGLCSSLWDKIVRSHAADFLPPSEHWPRDGEAVESESAAARRFLDALSWTELARESTPGDGESFLLRGGVNGHALVWNGRLVHAAVFSAGDMRPLPAIR